MDIPPAEFVETIADLERLADVLQHYDRVAIDLESDSFYSYHEKICLVQLSSPEQDFIIDPLEVRDLSPLSGLFKNPEVEKVFHAAEYDIVCLKRDYGFELQNLFDTMIAARVLGSKELGLAPLIQRYFDVTLSKKLQRSDWGRRPLSVEQLDYAQMDTHYLLALRDKLHQELIRRELERDAKEEFERLTRLQPAPRAFDPDSFWRLPGARALTGQARAVLKELYFFREKTAAEMDRAAFRVLPELLLVRLAQELPRELSALEKTKGMTPFLFGRFGKDILGVVERGLQQPPIEQEPVRTPERRWDTLTQRRYEQLRQWRKTKAAERAVDTVVILATDDLREIAQAPTRSHDPDSWLSCLSERKRELYGAELLQLLSTPLPPSTSTGRRRRRRKRNPPTAAS